MNRKEMINFPIGANVCGNEILHEGNHDGRNNPHSQYIHKWDTYRTKVYTTDLTTTYCKIAEINYEKDNNTTLGYKIEIFSEYETDRIGYINISVSKTGVTNFSTNDNSYFGAFYVITDTDNTNGEKTKSKVELFVKLSKNYRAVYYRLINATNSQPVSFSNYTNNYAYNCITMLSYQDFLTDVANKVQATIYPTTGKNNLTGMGDGTISGAISNLYTMTTATVVYNGITFEFHRVGRLCTVKFVGSVPTQAVMGAWFAILPLSQIPLEYRCTFALSEVMISVLSGVRIDCGYTSPNGFSIFPRSGALETTDIIQKTFTYIV